MRGPKHKLSEEEQTTACERYLSMESSKKISSELQISVNTLLRIIKKHGHSPRHRGREKGWSATWKEKGYIVGWYKGGMTLQAIGDRLGITGERVRQILEKFGVTGKVERDSRTEKALVEAKLIVGESRNKDLWYKAKEKIRSIPRVSVAAIRKLFGRKFLRPCVICGSERKEMKTIKGVQCVCSIDCARKFTRERCAEFRRLNPDFMIKATGEYAKKHPDRIRIYAKTQRLKKSGLIKQTPCVVCGATKVHAHHPDYSKPLNVVWLCPAHHKLTHKHSLSAVMSGSVA